MAQSYALLIEYMTMRGLIMYDSTQDTLKTELIRIANALESIGSPSYPQTPSWVDSKGNAMRRLENLEKNFDSDVLIYWDNESHVLRVSTEYDNFIYFPYVPVDGPTGFFPGQDVVQGINREIDRFKLWHNQLDAIDVDYND